MTDDCGDIEYLDEDEEIVHQYVQSAQIPENDSNAEDIEEKITPLLVERKRFTSKRKPKSEEEDSDYDPNEDRDIDDDFDPRQRKRKKTPAKRPSKFPAQSHNTPQTYRHIPFNAKVPLEDRSTVSKPASKPTDVHRDAWSDRKKLQILIPDYEDALCLPVRAVKLDENDMTRLKQWNNVCLENLRKGENVLKTEREETKSSTRTIVLRNAPNKKTGRVDTHIWCKTQVENVKGERRSEITQSILPRYREKRLVTPFRLTKTPIKHVQHKYEVVLTKEDNKGEETLVVYNAKEAVSAVYKLISKKNSEDESEEQEEAPCSSLLKEVVCCKLCAPCYQLSWRGIRKVDNGNNMLCPVCERTFVSVYNLLTHLRAHHSHAEVRLHRHAISTMLAGVVGYHYKCRVCLNEFPTITQLRKHVFEHQGTDVFKCEVGNHMAS